MFIRQTKTNNKATGEGYFTFRLVRGERIGGKVRQITVLNLGRNFAVKQEDWPLLCSRIEQLMTSQDSLLPIACPESIEHLAQRYVGQLVLRAPAQAEGGIDVAGDPVSAVAQDKSSAADIMEVDVNSLELSQPRSVGVEHLALHALSQLGLVEKLAELGVNGVQRAAILGNLVGRMAEPASELATWNWLQTRSALGELIDVDFHSMSHMTLYRASDLLMHHRAAIEKHVFSAVETLFGLEETVTLYDLTNTYFEGEAEGNAKAKRGRSKEKRSDCPLLTLGLVLDGSGFVRRSQTFAGNVSEGATLPVMLDGLGAPHGALVIMDAGIATEANLAWLLEKGYRYLVVRRGGARQFDEEQDHTAIETASGETLRLQKKTSADGKEVELYCHSEKREAKELAMLARFAVAFEEGLQKLADGLQKPRGEKKQAKLLERIGKLKQKSRGASRHYQVDLATDEAGDKVIGLTWEKTPVDGTSATHPGVYCLRSSETDWNDEKLWRTYTMLTDLESVFRSLKSELGLRPVFHSKENRCDGHLFITVLAYQCVQVLRTTLKQAGINDSWPGLRQILTVQRRVTASLRRTDGRTIHVRKSTVAEPALKKIYTALGVTSLPGGIRKMST
jgi:transposase